jgi:hypothetical protein
MKTSYLALAFLVSSTLAQAQVAGTAASTGVQLSLPAPTAFSAVSRDGGSTVWERTVYERGPNGTAVPRKSRYTELASGLNFKDPVTKQWKTSREAIDLLPPGQTFAAQAVNGQHQARFPLDIAQGVIQLAAGGQQLTSRPVGLYLEDDNNSYLIALLTNSVGELVGSNQVVYPQAFEGVNASIRYRYTRSAFEQDIVILGQLPDPATLGLNPAKTRLGVLTVFFGTNNPVATTGPVDKAEGLSDQTLKFGNGSMRIGQGRAFAIGDPDPDLPAPKMTPATFLASITNAAQRAAAKGTPTYKRWFQMQGHKFLMEEVPYHRLSKQLKQLPPATGRLEGASTNLYATDTFLKAIPSGLLASSASAAPDERRTMRLSKLDLDTTPAVVLDYLVTVYAPGDWQHNSGDYTFQSGVTYYLPAPCYFDNVTFEPGCVIKYPNVNSVNSTLIGGYAYGTVFLNIVETITCPTTGDNPAIFTAVDDNTVGEQIGNGSPAGNFYANPAIFKEGNVTLSNVRVRYAQEAFLVSDDSSLTLSDSQVTDTGVMAMFGFGYDTGGYSTITLTCNNCLFDAGSSYYGMVAIDSGNDIGNFNFNNCTINNAYCVIGYGNSGCFVNAVNSIFANTGWLGCYSGQCSYNGFYNCSTFGDNPLSASAYPFQTSILGNFYLTPGSNPFRDAGTSDNLDPALLANLQTATTYAPQNGSLADTGTPDLGYHYPINSADADADGLPDWWERYWFGNLTHSGSNLDSQGHTLLSDYQNFTNGLWTIYDPNVISFSVESTNQFVNTSHPGVQLSITAGVPSYYAVLTDSANFAGATWMDYTTTNVTVDLGANDGWHNVWIGLKGYASGATVSWRCKRLKLDTTPPRFVITSPTNSTVNVPMIQLTGYSPEALSRISYDLTNSLGLVTNQQALIADQAYSTNTWEFTTNYFQCYDVPLTSGTNTITLHARDLAGNVTTTNFSFTINYAGKPAPVAEVQWPPAGARVGGDDYTIVGKVDDYTATVAAALTDADGLTYNLEGVVERDGRFWVDHVPILSGTNVVTLTFSNAAGTVVITSITNYQSSLNLTLESTVSGDPNLWNSSCFVWGTVASDDCAVWVNGVEMSVDDGILYWYGTVPISPGGVATFNISVYPANEDPAGPGDPGNGSGAGFQNPSDPNAVVYEFNLDKPVRVYVAQDERNISSSTHGHTLFWAAAETTTPADAFYWSDSAQTYRFDQHWNDGGDNGGSIYNSSVVVQNPGEDSTGISTEQMSWPQHLWPWQNDYGTGIFGGTGGSYSKSIDGPMIWPEHCEVSDPVGPTFTYGYEMGFNYSRWVGTEYDETYERHVQTTMKLATGGRSAPGHKSLIRITGWATVVPYKRAVPPFNQYFDYANWPTIPPEQLKVGTLGNLDANGELWVVLPDGDPDVTIFPPPMFCFSIFGLTATKPEIAIQANGKTLNSDYVVPGADFCVGEYIKFDIIGIDPTGHSVVWDLPGTFVNRQPDSNCLRFFNKDDTKLIRHFDNDRTLSTYCWYVRGLQQKTVTVTIYYYNGNGQVISYPITGKFNVHRPVVIKDEYVDGYPTPQTSGNGAYLTLGEESQKANEPVAGDMSFRHRIQSGNFPGHAGYIQIVGDDGDKSHIDWPTLTDPTGSINHYPRNELDTLPGHGDFPRGTTQIPANPLHLPLFGWTLPFYDGPWVYLAPPALESYQHLHFHTYLMFRPDPQPGDLENNIFVPLQKIDWYLNQKGQNGNGVLNEHDARITWDDDWSEFPHWDRESNPNTTKNIDNPGQ